MPYDRLEQWRRFSGQMERHIKEYTIVQYGTPEGTEQADGFTAEDCFTNMMRYVNRRNSNVRGSKELLRDCLKIAHYASFAYDKRKADLSEEDVYAGMENPVE